MSGDNHPLPDVVIPVVRAMRENVAVGLTLGDMVDIACLSPFHFHRVFHRAVGIPPGSFYTALRMDAAKRLLLTTAESILDVCFSVGYSSPGTFTTSFARLVGETPGSFRALSRLFSDAGIWATGLAATEASGPHDGIGMGRVSGRPGFRGMIFVGAFAKRIPRRCRSRAFCWRSRADTAFVPYPTASTTS